MSDPVRIAQFIGSSFVESREPGTFASLNPSDPADVVALAPRGAKEDAAKAVQAASQAFPTWRHMSGPARADALYQWASRIQDRHEELSQAIAREVGKPLGEARGEVSRCIAILRYFAGDAVRSVGEVIPALSDGPLQYSLRQPLGVVTLITPWNFPLAIPLWKAAPALAMGNTVVFKPAEQSPWCAQLLAETSIGLPDGAFNVVQGDGETVGTALIEDPGVKAVSFTGSIEVGTIIQKVSAARNVKCQTEMGGKNAAIVLKDADLPRAAGLVAAGAMRFAGQKCTATSRVIVEKAVYTEFVSVLVKAVESLPVGPASDPATAVGPVIEESAQHRLTRALENSPFEREHVSRATCPGYYVPPTVFGRVDPGSDLAQDELFGPVLAVLEAEDLDHAVEIGNATRFGLSTAVYTQDISSAMRFVDRIEAGLVRVNGDTTGVDPHAPFGGTKASSSGTREQGPVAKDFYSEWKTVQINP